MEVPVELLDDVGSDVVAGLGVVIVNRELLGQVQRRKFGCWFVGLFFWYKDQRWHQDVIVSGVVVARRVVSIDFVEWGLRGSHGQGGGRLWTRGAQTRQ